MVSRRIPAWGKTQNPVARKAVKRETEYLKPIDKVIL
jgi:hypothetical protein